MTLNRNIFRTYDIRAIADVDLKEDSVRQIAKAFALKLESLNQHNVAVGHDARLSSERIHHTFTNALCEYGINVTDIGLVPTPVLYFACKVLPDLNSGIMITASHNPAPYNGFKALLDNRVLTSDEIAALYTLSFETKETRAAGELNHYPHICEDYAKALCENITLKTKPRIVIDYSNGVTAHIAPQIFKQLGCDVIDLYQTLDGHFPNHPPEPTQPQNLTDLIAAVKTNHADLGIAFDGDGDRMVAVTGAGEFVFPDRLLMLFAQSVLSQHPNKPVVFDVKCSHKLPAIITASRGKAIISATGHTLIKRLAKAKKAVLAGEMSGHFIFYDRWYDFDDGIYAAARLLELITHSGKNLSTLNAALPETYATPELQVSIKEDEKNKLMTTLKSLEFPKANMSYIDGIRADFSDGFALVRASNTTPCLVIRFEADTPERLIEIQSLFKSQVTTLCPDLTLPF